MPPFRFTGDTVTFSPPISGRSIPASASSAPITPTPTSDLEEGVLSTVDLRYFRAASVDFHGRVGELAGAGPGLDWLFDIVEPRDGDWNVYAHDRDLLEELRVDLRRRGPYCPVDELRLAGSRYNLYTRYFEDRPGE